MAGVGINQSEDYASAKLHLAARTAIILAGCLQRNDLLDKQSEEEIAGLLNQLRHSAQMSGSNRLFEEAMNLSKEFGRRSEG